MDLLELIRTALGPNEAAAATPPPTAEQPLPSPTPTPLSSPVPPPSNRLQGFAQGGNIAPAAPGGLLDTLRGALAGGAKAPAGPTSIPALPQGIPGSQVIDGMQPGQTPSPQPMTDEIRRMFGMPQPSNAPRGPAAPARQPQPYQSPAVGGAWQTTASRPTPPAQPQQAMSPEAADMQRAIRAFFSGAANVNPTSPKFSAFAQGASGAMQSRYKEQTTEEKQRADLAAKRFDQGLKLSKHDRDERAADRADRAETRAEGKDKRDAQSAEVLNTARTARVMRMLDPNLDVKDRIAVERLVRDYGRDMARRDPTLDDATAIQRMEAYRKEVEGRVKAKKPAEPVSSATPGPAPTQVPTPKSPAVAPKPQGTPPTPKPGQKMGGYTFKGGDPSDAANWEQAQ